MPGALAFALCCNWLLLTVLLLLLLHSEAALLVLRALPCATSALLVRMPAYSGYSARS